ncbi:MAG: hypothetical protein LBI13_00805 [Streptococcaceae bacterium]|nr:hypothetical protein [Streptococcaceae bacterium]
MDTLIYIIGTIITILGIYFVDLKRVKLEKPIAVTDVENSEEGSTSEHDMKRLRLSFVPIPAFIITLILALAGTITLQLIYPIDAITLEGHIFTFLTLFLSFGGLLSSGWAILRFITNNQKTYTLSQRLWFILLAVIGIIIIILLWPIVFH